MCALSPSIQRVYRGSFPPERTELIDQLVDLPEVLGHGPQLGQRPRQPFGEGSEDVGGLADAGPAFGVRDPGFGVGVGGLGGCDRGGAGTVAAVARLPGGQCVGGGQGLAGLRQVTAGLPEVPLRAVCGQGDLFPESGHLAQLLADLLLGIRQRLEELPVRAVPGAVPPVLPAARAVPGARPPPAGSMSNWPGSLQASSEVCLISYG